MSSEVEPTAQSQKKKSPYFEFFGVFVSASAIFGGFLYFLGIYYYNSLLWTMFEAEASPLSFFSPTAIVYAGFHSLETFLPFLAPALIVGPIYINYLKKRTRIAWPKRLLSSKSQLVLIAAIFLSAYIFRTLSDITVDSFEISLLKILFSVILLIPILAGAHIAIGGKRVAFDDLYIKTIFIGLTIIGSMYLALNMAFLSGTSDAYVGEVAGSFPPDAIVQITEPLPAKFNSYQLTSKRGYHQYKFILLSHGEGVHHFSIYNEKELLPFDLVTIPNEKIISVRTLPY